MAEFAKSKMYSPQDFLQELEDLIVRKKCYILEKVSGNKSSMVSVRKKFRNILMNRIDSLNIVDVKDVLMLSPNKEPNKSEWLFTTKRLVALGMHDEIRSLYIQLCYIGKSYKDSPPFAGDRDYFYKYGNFKERILYKKCINIFLYQNSAFFYDHPLYLNDDILRNGCAGMTMFADDQNAMNIYHEEKLITFSVFQKYLHHLILTILVKTRKRNGEDIYRDDVYWELKERLDKIMVDTDYKSSILNIEHIEYDLTVDSKTIWVYVNIHNLTCNQCEPRHLIVPKTVSVKLLNGEHRCNLHINYCEVCKEYFIGKHSLAIAQKEHGTLLARLHSCSPKQCSDITWNEFNSESELHSCGYRVGESGLSFVDRRDLLKKLLDTGVMDKFSIRRDISKAISIFENNPLQINAVKDWYEDLEFIDGYGNDEYVGKAHLRRTTEVDNSG